MPKSTRRTTVAKGAAIDKRIDSALDNLVIAYNDATKAVATRGKESKKLTATVKRLNKKRGTLAKRKVTAAARVKNMPDAENRKALRTIEKDLAAVRKELTKARTQKSAASAELAVVKASNRKISAYMKAIEKTEKLLNKPKRKRRKKRAA